ncbi:basic proline-rich protein-like [Cavia porcellus]|uniref:basic proline-rich protein-like n=1 Tax=Cavia porcellus TaxID=10141 RepID=UPI002FE0E398
MSAACLNFFIKKSVSIHGQLEEAQLSLKYFHQKLHSWGFPSPPTEPGRGSPTLRRGKSGRGSEVGPRPPGSTPARAPAVGAQSAPRPRWPRYCFTFPGVYFSLIGKKRPGKKAAGGSVSAAGARSPRTRPARRGVRGPAEQRAPPPPAGPGRAPPPPPPRARARPPARPAQEADLAPARSLRAPPRAAQSVGRCRRAPRGTRCFPSRRCYSPGSRAPAPPESPPPSSSPARGTGRGEASWGEGGGLGGGPAPARVAPPLPSPPPPGDPRAAGPGGRAQAWLHEAPGRAAAG